MYKYMRKMSRYFVWTSKPSLAISGNADVNASYSITNTYVVHKLNGYEILKRS